MKFQLAIAKSIFVFLIVAVSLSNAELPTPLISSDNDPVAQDALKLLNSYKYKTANGLLSESDYDVIANCYLILGWLDRAIAATESGLRKYRNSKKLKERLFSIKQLLLLREVYLKPIDDKLQSYAIKFSKINGESHYLSGISATRSLIRTLGDIIERKTLVVVTYQEGGKTKRGYINVGRRAAEEWSKALDSIGVKFKLEHIDKVTHKDIGACLTMEKINKWSHKLIVIDEGPYKGAYMKTQKVVFMGKSYYEVVFPSVKYFQEAYRKEIN